jgi:hypothetical protein
MERSSLTLSSILALTWFGAALLALVMFAWGSGAPPLSASMDHGSGAAAEHGEGYASLSR